MRFVVRKQAIPVINCDVGMIREVAGKHPKFLLMALDPGCPNGQAMRDLLTENREKLEGEGIHVEEMFIDTKKCNELADHMEIAACPTMIFYRNKTEVRRFVPSGEGMDEVLKEVMSFKGKPKRIE